jgi:hypothetical protein
MALEIRPHAIDQDSGPFTFPSVFIGEGPFIPYAFDSGDVPVLDIRGGDSPVSIESGYILFPINGSPAGLKFVDLQGDIYWFPDNTFDMGEISTSMTALATGWFVQRGDTDTNYTVLALNYTTPPTADWLSVRLNNVNALFVYPDEIRAMVPIFSWEPLYLLERAAAAADTPAYGQVWVKNTSPCELWFTDDNGLDTQIV